MEIVVFGAGSLGSLVGGVLAREHDVTLVCRGDHAAAVRESGLTIEGELEGVVHPAVTTVGTDLAADLVVVTVKAFDTEGAARTLATGRFGAACSLQNGMGNEETLAAHLECPVLAGTATCGAVRRDAGVVECTGLGEITLGANAGGPSSVADRVGAAFAAGGLEATVAEDMPRRLWEKLAVNAGINAVTALARTENGSVFSGPATDVARAATRETARTARAVGVGLANRTALAAVESVAAGTASNASSMLQDVRSDRRTEVDAINGYVVDRAEAVGLEAPTNRTLAALVRAWERERGLR